MSEARAAAERLRGGFNYANCPDGWGECNDARTLAEAWLAEHPADQREPEPGLEVPNGPGVWEREGQFYLARMFSAVLIINLIHKDGVISQAGYISSAAPRGHWQKCEPTSVEGERLRIENDGYRAAFDDQHAEIERLRGVCNEWGSNYHSWVDATKAAEQRTETLEAELAAAKAQAEALQRQLDAISGEATGAMPEALPFAPCDNDWSPAYASVVGLRRELTALRQSVAAGERERDASDRELLKLQKWLIAHESQWRCMSGSPVDVAIAVMSRLGIIDAALAQPTAEGQEQANANE
jgi:hypothetical protein